MTVEQFAERYHARRIVQGRWIARCPAHADKTPSLSIAVGRDDRVLVNCFAGCTLTSILEAAGLQRRDLFPRVQAPERIRAAAAQRQKVEQEAQRLRDERRNKVARLRKLEAIASELGNRLAKTFDGAPDGGRLMNLFHQSMDRIHELETELYGK